MRFRGTKVLHLAVPIKAVAQRFAYLLLVAAAVALLIISKADLALTERLRTAMIDIASPVLQLLARPIQTAQQGVTAVENLVTLHRDNTRLRDENARLLHWQQIALRLEQENAALRRLLAVSQDATYDAIAARVIGDTGGPFVRTMLLDAGARDGVRKGQAVVTEHGLVGRIVDAGQRAGRVLLLTDLNSRIPVLVEHSRQRAILAGDNSGQPRLEYLMAAAQLTPGDRIVTSGDGGLFPPGLLVGTVVGAGDRAPRVRPAVDFGQVEFVRVLRYDRPKPAPDPDPTGGSGQ